MSWGLGGLSDDGGSLAADSRAVSNLVGFMLLFSILLLALAGYQAQVVPQETAQSEFEHHQTVQEDLIEFRNAVFETATAGDSSFGSATATSVTLGTTHPSRILTVGPPSSAGTIQTTDSYNITVQNMRTNRTEEVPTRFVEYNPQYSEYQVGSIWYENSMLYLEDEDAEEPIVLADQQLDTGSTVRIIPTQNEIDENSIGTESIEMEVASAVEENPELFDADTRRMRIELPTRLDDSEYWEGELAESVNYSISPDAYADGVHKLELLVEPDIEINTVGHQSEPTENPLRSPNDAGREFSDSTDPDMSGTGEEEDPYVIMNSDHLQNISNAPGKYYVLGDNIDASDTSNWNGGDGFDPVGNDTDPFTGTLDGDGYFIHGLTIDRDQNSVGLFNTTYEATIQNIGIEETDIDAENRVGGVAGSLENSRIENSYVTGDIDGDDNVGGLVGEQSDSTVENSYTRGNVIGSSDFSIRVGGLVGGSDGTDSSIRNSHSTATVNVTNGIGESGGLVGLLGGQVTVENSYATGDVEGDINVGGLVGVVDGSVTNTYATGNINGDDNVGGLVGFNSNGEVANSYATGAVDGNDNVGGLVGKNANGNIVDSYWDKGTTNQEDGDFVDDDNFGLGDTNDAEPADEMRGAAALGNMTEFDFEDEWQILTHPDDYPLLRR